MNRFFEEFHYYETAEKRAILLLLSGILAVIVLHLLSPFASSDRQADDGQMQQKRQEYEQFAASLHEAVPADSGTATYRRAYASGRSSSPRLSSSRTATAFPASVRPAPNRDRDTAHAETPVLYLPDTLSARRAFKYPEVVVINLNTADTTELKKIPGIGSGIARMIVGYRQQLGGYYDVSQLKDLRLDYEQLIPWFETRPEDLRLLPVNRSSIERLRSHPYINFHQAKALVEYRKKHGSIPNLRVFSLYDEFTEHDLERIGHYLSFE